MSTLFPRELRIRAVLALLKPAAAMLFCGACIAQGTPALSLDDALRLAQDRSRLLVAQDTGGAIRGPVRGDVYWGSTARADGIAGRMAHKGQLYVLVPKAVAARLN